jgi:LytS/YehU family sensor histidine kinase
MGLLAGLRGGITIAGLAVAIKLMKHWYLKEQRNLQLQKENTESQLQLLKAQIHPHFLFNTLNNIYSITQDTSPIASKLLIALSDMLRYILYEGSQELVPLAKEMKMMEEYIYMEKIRYGNKLDIHISLPDTKDLLITPLLLLPFVENCFKHGTSNMLEQPWMSVDINIQGNTLAMKLLNGKSPAIGQKAQLPGIGIANARKRLQLLYPGKHELAITHEEDVFIVNLKVELEKQDASSLVSAPQTETSFAHA